MHPVAAVLFIVTLAVVGEGKPVLAPYTRPANIAHRGASGDAPEHTLAAYQLALTQGADFVEPDLQLTRDGVLVCLHDTSLERTTDVETVFPERATEVKGRKAWPVAGFTLKEIQQLDAGSWKGRQFAGQKVPTFQQMIDVVKGKAGMIPETKSPDAHEKRGLSMERELMAVLEANGLDIPGADPETPVIIQSFSTDSLRSLRRDHGCRLPLTYLCASDQSTEQLRMLRDFADGIAPSKAVVLKRPELVAEAHALGMSVTVWTCRDGSTGAFEDVRAEMGHLLNVLKVDAIFTDNPDKFPRGE
jgi:glycerophosphoryl diester phosphodiesterase